MLKLDRINNYNIIIKNNQLKAPFLIGEGLRRSKMSSPAINTVIKMMESLSEEEQDGVMEHLREYIQDLQDEYKCHEKYREIVKRVLEKYAYYYMYSDEDNCIQCQLIISYDRNHYFLATVGNDGIRRFFHCIFHLEIKNNRIYIFSSKCR